tara:strand:+ start:3296 stop:3484 length:189 start_codon:yes stop_codon:yes gene_type:complete
MPVLTQDGIDEDELVFLHSVEVLDEPPFGTEPPSPPPQATRPISNIIEQIIFIKPPCFHIFY